MKKAIAILAASLPVVAQAQSVTDLGYFDGWRVFRHTSGECVMDAELVGGTVTIHTPNNEPTSVVISIQNPSWKSLVVGREYPIQFQIGQSMTNGVSFATPAFHGGVAITTKVERRRFFNILGSRTPMNIMANGKAIMQLGPRDDRASQALARCANAADRGDPFAQ